MYAIINQIRRRIRESTTIMTPSPEPPADALATLAAAIAHDPAPRHTQPAWELARTLAARHKPPATISYRPLSCAARLAVPGVRHLLPRPVVVTGIVHYHHRPFLVQLRHTDHSVVVPAGWVTSTDVDLADAEPPGPAPTPPAGTPALTPDLRDQLGTLLTDEVATQLHHQGTDLDALQHLLHAPAGNTPRTGHRLTLPGAAMLTGLAAEDLALLVGHGILGADPNPVGGVDVDLLDVLALARTARPDAHPDTPTASALAIPPTTAAGLAAISAQLVEMCTPQTWLAGHGREYVRACLENLPGPHAWGSDPAVRDAAKAAAIDGLLTLEHDPPAARHALYRAITRHRTLLTDEVRYHQHPVAARAANLGLDELGGAIVASHIEVAGHWLAAELPAGPGRSCVVARRLGEVSAGAALVEIREMINSLDIAVYDVA